MNPKLCRSLFYLSLLLSAAMLVVGQPAAAHFLAVGAVISGARATEGTQGIDQNSRVIDMSDVIHLLDPNEAPLTALLMKLRKVEAKNYKYEWLEDDYLPTTTLAVGTVANTTSANTIVVTAGTGTYFRAGDVLKSLDTGETMYVTSVSTDTLTVVRAIGSTTIGAVNNADPLLRIGNSNVDGAGKRALKSVKKEPFYNFTQITRTPFGATGRTMASELYGGDDLSYQTRKQGIEHRKEIETTLLYGERHDGTAAIGITASQTFTGGFIERVTSNVATTDPVTKITLEAWLRDLFRYGSAERVLFCSRLWISLLNQIAIASIQTIPSTESFPLALKEYVSGHGTIYMITHNQLTGDGANNHAYGGWALGADLDSLYYRYLRGRDTKLRTNIQTNDEDARIDEWMTDCGLQMIQQQKHGVYKNATSVA